MLLKFPVRGKISFVTESVEDGSLLEGRLDKFSRVGPNDKQFYSWLIFGVHGKTTSISAVLPLLSEA